MKNNIYVIYNTLSKRYGDIICFPSDEFAIHQVKRVMKEDDLAVNEICRVGSINIETGIIETTAPVRLTFDIDTNLPTSEVK